METAVGSRMRLARLRIGISQTEAAHRIGVAPSTISGAERGQSKLSIDVLSRLADLYKVQVDFLLRGDSLPWASRLPTGAQKPETIAAALRAAREEKKLSQGDIARLTGLSPSLISRAEAGKRKASVEVLAGYARATDHEVGWFISGYEWTLESDDPKFEWVRSLRHFLRSVIGSELAPTPEEVLDLAYQVAWSGEWEKDDNGWAGLLHSIRVSRGEHRTKRLLGKPVSDEKVVEEASATAAD